jgi:SAM-dependent methyltransferase
MGFYRDRVYPRLVTKLGDPAPIRARRRELLSRARGRVLEIGVGPGVNFPHYDAGRVTKLFALEPNDGMIRLAEKARTRTSLEIEFLGLPGERIPLEDASVDTVVSTFTLCTIPGIAEALRGIARVLEPGGELIFFEISRSPDASVQRWQRLWEPVHRSLFQGLCLTRDIPSLIGEAGFRLENVANGYVASFPKSWAHCSWGTAIRRPRAVAPFAGPVAV